MCLMCQLENSFQVVNQCLFRSNIWQMKQEVEMFDVIGALGVEPTGDEWQHVKNDLNMDSEDA